MKSLGQMTWSVQQAAGISTIFHSNDLKGHILNIITSTSEIWRLPWQAAFTWDITADGFLNLCASLPNWPWSLVGNAIHCHKLTQRSCGNKSICVFFMPVLPSFHVESKLPVALELQGDTKAELNNLLLTRHLQVHYKECAKHSLVLQALCFK